jgi:hypothetical protein
MKRLLFTLVIIISANLFYAHAQNLTLSRNDVDVSNDVVNIEGTPNDEIKVVFNITNTSALDINIKIKKRVNEDIEGSDNTFCLTSCFNPDVTESPDPYTIAAGETTNNDVFYVQFYPNGISGNAQISYEVFNVDNNEEKVTVTVNYIITPTGVVVNELSSNIKAYPNPVTGSRINFNFSIQPSVSNPRLKVFNLLGVKVFEVELSYLNSDIEVDISKLSKGIYLYTLEGNSKNLITKKLIVR